MVKQAQKKRNGFTIVELIVVIVVIGILASIVIVSYNGYQQKANKSAANATIQQVKLKLGEYYTDNNSYPTSSTTIDTYLRSVNQSSLADSFKAMITAGATYVPLASDGSNCSTGTPACAKYTITVPASYWKGTDSALVLNVP